MLDLVFGFGLRIGRLHYFLATIGLAVVMTLLVGGMTISAFSHVKINPQMMLASLAWPIVVLGVVFAFLTVMLQCMRVRDIGWDPVCVMPAWFAIAMVDGVVATKFPALALGYHQQATAVGGLVNLGLFLALTFWPGGDAAPAAETSFPRPTSGVPNDRLAGFVKGQR